MTPRHDEILVLGQEPRDHFGVVGLLDEVELGAKMRLELVGERLRLQELRALRTPLEEGGRRAHQREVEPDLLLDPGAAHLDDHLAAALQQRRVHLRNRRRCDRLRIDADEEIGGKLLGQDALNLGEGHGRHLVDELFELLGVDVGQEIGPRRAAAGRA